MLEGFLESLMVKGLWSCQVEELPGLAAEHRVMLMCRSQAAMLNAHM